MIEYLRPISNRHSIGRVQASVFLPYPVVRPEELFKDLKTNPDFNRYQKKTLKKIRKIGINLQDSVFNNTSEEVDGFVFEEYNDEGLLVNFISIQNEQNRSVLSFETRNYINWNTFFFRFKEDVEFMSKAITIYVQSLSLTFIDEFIWTDDSEIPVREIFNVDSDLINNKFLASENGSIILLSQNSEQKIEEKTEIIFSNRLRRVSINHQYVEVLAKLFTIHEFNENNIFEKKFKEAHRYNKTMLINLLSEEVKNRISLKN